MSSNKQKSDIVPLDSCEADIKSLVYTIRGQQVMLDSDLAMLYGYEVKNLNRQVKNNIARFPNDFLFRLTKAEVDYLRCNFCTANLKNKSRSLPYAFTEQGIYMLAAVLKGELAEQQSIFIMRAFREMRHYIRQNQQFVTKSEMLTLTDTVTDGIRKLNERQDQTDTEIASIKKSITKISKSFTTDADFKSFVIYKGQKFEADKAYIDIYQKAKKSIYVVDNYVNIKTLHLLSHKKNGVQVVLFTENGFGQSKDFLTSSEVSDFNKEYPSIQIKPNPDCHDRFIVLDYSTKREQVFHCGASSKDAGKKVCAINQLENTALIHPVIDSLLLNPDITI